MRPEDLQDYLRPATFRPFRISMNGGRTFDIGHPEMIKVARSVALVFEVGPDGVVDRWESISLLLVETVKHLDSPPMPLQGNGQQA